MVRGTEEMLAKAPGFAYLAPYIRGASLGKTVAIYNSDFDYASRRRFKRLLRVGAAGRTSRHRATPLK